MRVPDPRRAGRIGTPGADQDLGWDVAPGRLNDAKAGQSPGHPRAQLRQCRSVREVDLVQDHEVGVADLAENQVAGCPILGLFRQALSVNHCGDPVEPNCVAIGRGHERSDDPGWVCDTAGFEQNPFELVLRPHQLANRGHQIVTDLAAHASVRELDLPRFDSDDQLGVDAQLAKIVDKDSQPTTAFVGENPIQQGRLSGPKESGKHRDRHGRGHLPGAASTWGRQEVHRLYPRHSPAIVETLTGDAP